MTVDGMISSMLEKLSEGGGRWQGVGVAPLHLVKEKTQKVELEISVEGRYKIIERNEGL